jgi:outer membrane protein TolC
MCYKPVCNRFPSLLSGFLCALGLFGLGIERGKSQPPPPPTQETPPALSRDAAIVWALERNPELATLRQQRGIAAAAIVIAETYPFNPTWEGKIRAASGPTSAGITNRVSNEHKLFMDVETRGQGAYRREGANAALSRVEWDVAFQEMNLAIRVVKAFDSVLYRQEKMALLERTVKLDQETVKQVRDLVTLGKLHGPDLILAQTEVDDVRSQLSPARTALVAARYDLRRALGMVDDSIHLDGKLDTHLVTWDATELVTVGLERRADLRSKRAAVAEAEARLDLERANRYGNWNLGPAMEYDPTRILLLGVQITRPIPVFNTHRGEILQREEELTGANLAVQQTEVLVRQDVRAALARLNEADRRVHLYRSEVLPNLRQSVKDFQTLLEKGDPNVTVLHVVDIRRKLLKADDGYWDAVWEMRQALADLAAAIGDPALAVIQWTPPKPK